MSTTITQIPDKPAHDRIIAEAVSTPTVLYLSSSVLPACQRFTPEYEQIAQKNEVEGPAVRFCQMEYSNQTSPMFKFAQAQLPVVIFVYTDRWCQTLLSPTVKKFEAGLGELKAKASG